jgi:hypothetical protein
MWVGAGVEAFPYLLLRRPPRRRPSSRGRHHSSARRRSRRSPPSRWWWWWWPCTSGAAAVCAGRREVACARLFLSAFDRARVSCLSLASPRCQSGEGASASVMASCWLSITGSRPFTPARTDGWIVYASVTATYVQPLRFSERTTVICVAGGTRVSFVC